MQSGQVLSRAIISLMPDLSQREGRSLYAVFGVNTPEQLRGHGWASIHFRALRVAIRKRGGHMMELHVHEDNDPALRLYRRSGFVPIDRTATLRWYCR